jgi:hypothetical protein
MDFFADLEIELLPGKNMMKLYCFPYFVESEIYTEEVLNL